MTQAVHCPKTDRANRGAPHHRVRAAGHWNQGKLKQLLDRAQERPSSILANSRCGEPDFCAAYFDLCDGQALVAPAAALDYALYAVELARRTRDPHRSNRSYGVLVHAYVAREDWEGARAVLAGYKDAALGCCSACKSDYFRRQGDFQIETGKAEDALGSLAACLREAGPDLDADGRGRIRFLRGIAQSLLGDRERAVDDAGRALLDLSFASPRGYFLDAIALIAVFLHRGERCQAEQALEHLERFKARLIGVRDLTDVRARLSWVEGLLHAWLGDLRRAGDRLESARQWLLDRGLPREAVAVTVDRALLLSRTSHEANERAIRRLIATCLRRRGAELPADLRRGMEKLDAVVVRRPEQIFDELVVFRASFRAPVPGWLGQRLDWWLGAQDP